MASKTKKASAGSPAAVRRVTLIAPLAGPAEAVVVTGDFSQWSREGIRLERGPDGKWSTTLQLRPGVYQYRLIVDGQWWNNPGAERRVANAFGYENDVLVVA
jgi:hypothetical protein